MKISVYATKINILEDLEAKIINAVQSISQTTLQNVLNETTQMKKMCGTEWTTR
jgi:hypothetical protein